MAPIIFYYQKIQLFFCSTYPENLTALLSRFSWTLEKLTNCPSQFVFFGAELWHLLFLALQI